jgi:hypothetical protein
MSDNKLGSFLTEVSSWRWNEFVKAEHDKSYTSNQSLIFALVRACAMQKMDAIKLSLNRLDGKLKTPIKIEYPKIFYQYPNATLPEPDKATMADVVNGTAKGQAAVGRALIEAAKDQAAITGEVMVPEPPEEKDLPSMGLRETLTEMSDYPRDLPQGIVDLALQTEQWMRNQAPQPDEIPFVKSVVAAHLLILAQSRNIDALAEVFDQIDGKLAETIQLLGDNIYITSYLTEPPPGAYLNKDGVVEVEAVVAQDIWANKLGREMSA